MTKGTHSSDAIPTWSSTRRSTLLSSEAWLHTKILRLRNARPERLLLTPTEAPTRARAEPLARTTRIRRPLLTKPIAAASAAGTSLVSSWSVRSMTASSSRDLYSSARGSSVAKCNFALATALTIDA